MSDKQEMTTAAQAPHKAVTADEFDHAMALLEMAVENGPYESAKQHMLESKEMKAFKEIEYQARYPWYRCKRSGDVAHLLQDLDELWPKVKDQFRWKRIGQLRYEEARGRLKEAIKEGPPKDEIASIDRWCRVAVWLALSSVVIMLWKELCK